MQLYYGNKLISNVSSANIHLTILEKLGLPAGDFYLLHNGKRLCSDACVTTGKIHVIPRLVGGKGGFGSMLRAIGAQIEKTTNREACRDLSGRRLRDINEEQRLKNWIAAQAEREKEAAARKQKKLERLCEQPKHEFKDVTYDEARATLPEKVEDAVLQGLKASCGTKRKHESVKPQAKKKPKLWIDDVEVSSSSDEDDMETETSKEGVRQAKSTGDDSNFEDEASVAVGNSTLDVFKGKPAVQEAECK